MCTVVLVEVVRKGDRQNEIQQAFEPTQPRSAGERLIDCQKPRGHLVEVLDRGEDIPKDIIVCLFITSASSARFHALFRERYVPFGSSDSLLRLVSPSAPCEHRNAHE